MLIKLKRVLKPKGVMITEGTQDTEQTYQRLQAWLGKRSGGSAHRN